MRAEVCALKGDVVLTLVQGSEGLCGSSWTVMSSPGWGPLGPTGPRAEQRPGCPWQCCSSTSGPGEHQS